MTETKRRNFGFGDKNNNKCARLKMDFAYMQQQSLYHHFEQLIELPPTNHQAYINLHIQCTKQQDELKQLLAYHYRKPS